MSESTESEANIQALNQFVVECGDLPKLEALLGRFNIFRVLQFEYGEIRHSNVLAWILNPEGSHGLHAAFLQKWLMRVLHECHTPPALPVDVATWQLFKVEVRREWHHIDVLAILTMADRSQWVLCIENKVRSQQRPGQLIDYRKIVEQEFPSAVHRLFIFLTKDSEPPEDSVYRCASYDQVHKSLHEAMNARQGSLGEEPRVLLENYLRLLEEKFMNKSEVARLALQIYQQHKRAIDVIASHTPKAIRNMVIEKVNRMLAKNKDSLSIMVEKPTSEGIIRFTPKCWDVPANRGFHSFQGNNRHVLLELKLFPNETAFNIASGRSPQPWIDQVWALAERKPFTGRIHWDVGWFCLFRVTNEQLTFADHSLTDPTEMADAAYAWLQDVLASKDVKAVIGIIAEQLANASPTSAV